MSIVRAAGAGEDGFREDLGALEGKREDKRSRLSFFQRLKGRGLSGERLIAGGECLGILEAEVFPAAEYRRCSVHFYRNVISATPRGKRGLAAKMQEGVHGQEGKEASLEKARQAAGSRRGTRKYMSMKHLRGISSAAQISIPRPEGRGMLFCKVGILCGFNPRTNV